MAFERFKYALFYRIGFTPWDGHALPVRLHELIEGSPPLRGVAAFAEEKRRGPRGFNQPEIERRFGQEWQFIGRSKDPAVSNRPDDPIYGYELRRK